MYAETEEIYTQLTAQNLKCVYDMKDGEAGAGSSGGGDTSFLESGFSEWIVTFKRSQPLCQPLTPDKPFSVTILAHTF